jgi:hypothetical protein
MTEIFHNEHRYGDLDTKLTDAIETVEPAGERTSSKATFVSGPKSVPLGYTMR